jgi:hypothetical protein
MFVNIEKVLDTDAINVYKGDTPTLAHPNERRNDVRGE